MINVKPVVIEALKRAHKNAFPRNLNTFKKFPCISYYEISNRPAASADDREYITEVIIVVDVWGKLSAEVSEMALKVNKEMTAIGFIREFSHDVDEKGDLEHKTMRYKYLG